MEITVNFNDMTTLRYLLIKEKLEWMWVIGPYFMWVAVSEVILSVGYFRWVGGGALYWASGVGWDIIFGWVCVSGLYGALIWKEGGGVGIILSGWKWVSVGALFNNTYLL